MRRLQASDERRSGTFICPDPRSRTYEEHSTNVRSSRSIIQSRRSAFGQVRTSPTIAKFESACPTTATCTAAVPNAARIESFRSAAASPLLVKGGTRRDTASQGGRLNAKTFSRAQPQNSWTFSTIQKVPASPPSEGIGGRPMSETPGRWAPRARSPSPTKSLTASAYDHVFVRWIRRFRTDPPHNVERNRYNYPAAQPRAI